MFERMFFFTLGLGCSAAIISITFVLSGKMFVVYLLFCSTGFCSTLSFPGLGHCNNALHFLLKNLGTILFYCAVCFPRCCPGPEVFPNIPSQADQAGGHTHQEEGWQGDTDDEGDQLRLLEEGHGPEAHHQGR